MTNEELRSRYELLQQVSDGATRTFLAMAPTRMVVMVHFLPDNDARSLVARVEQLSTADRERVLETADVDTSVVLVTKFIADFRSFDEWLDERVPRISGPTAAPVPPEPVSTDPEPAQAASDSANAAFGEFTQAFGGLPKQPAPRFAEPPRAVTPVEPPRSVTPPPVVEPTPQPGEFTRLFMAVTPEPEPQKKTPETGDFARFFSAPEPEPQKKASEPGEFTRIFGAASTGGAEARNPAPPTPKPDFNADFQSALQTPSYVTPPTSNPVVRSDDSYLDKLQSAGDFSSARQAPASASFSPYSLPGSEMSLPGAPGAAAPSYGPSEFTRVISGMAAVPKPPSPLPLPGATPPPVAPPAQNRLPLVIGLAAIVVLTLAFVLFFVLRNR